MVFKKNTFSALVIFFGIALFTVILSACGKEEACDLEEITYTNFIGNLLDNKCSNIGCHVSSASQGSLATYDDVVAFVSVGKILGALRHEDGFEAMPKNGDMLTDCQIDKIEAWIEDGTPE
jgi:hypothetical protein